MKKYLLFVVAALICSTTFCLNAQLLVRPNGTVRVGSFPDEDNGVLSEQLLDTITALQVYGKPLDYNNARITFGYQLLAPNYPLNVAVGRHAVC